MNLEGAKALAPQAVASTESDSVSGLRTMPEPRGWASADSVSNGPGSTPRTVWAGHSLLGQGQDIPGRPRLNLNLSEAN